MSLQYIPTIQGDSREAVLLSIVISLARAENKLAPSGYFSPGVDRAWVKDAFAFARECLDGQSAESFLDALGDETP